MKTFKEIWEAVWTLDDNARGRTVSNYVKLHEASETVHGAVQELIRLRIKSKEAEDIINYMGSPDAYAEFVRETKAVAWARAWKELAKRIKSRQKFLYNDFKGYKEHVEFLQGEMGTLRGQIAHYTNRIEFLEDVLKQSNEKYYQALGELKKAKEALKPPSESVEEYLSVEREILRLEAETEELRCRLDGMWFKLTPEEHKTLHELPAPKVNE